MHEPVVGMQPTSAPGFRRMFIEGRMTVGLMFPIESYAGDRPTMTRQSELAVRAEAAGAAALWVRDVRLRIPEFGDVGQVYDPYLNLKYGSRPAADVLDDLADQVLAEFPAGPARQRLPTVCGEIKTLCGSYLDVK
jgi:hypothetical protein